LAAGKGTRLALEEIPKCLVPINENPLLYYILSSLAPLHLKELLVVGGYQYELLKSHFLDLKPSMQTIFIENKDFDKGSILTVAKAVAGLVDDDFLLMNGDHLYSQFIMKKVAAYASSSNFNKVTIVCDRDRDLTDDDMKVEMENGSFKCMSKKLSVYEYGYVGMTLVPKQRVNNYISCVHQLLDAGHTNYNVEEIVNVLRRENQEAVQILDISGSAWIEVDTPADLSLAHLKIKEVLAHT